METRNGRQSCSMPLDNPELLGPEKDGSPSTEDCKYCYQNGEFTHPGLTLDEMKDRMTRIMDKETLPEDMLEAAINRLPHLKRWKTETAPSVFQGLK
ncbi:zinc ribbon domain-containing protein [Terrimonas alba]|uniref:zinc ribbon domain-containing protein n=1 Tax=Terrimonas alba TaxID=3349636 RepID=UPI0035F3108C